MAFKQCSIVLHILVCNVNEGDKEISTEVREIKLNFTMNETYFLSLYGI